MSRWDWVWSTVISALLAGAFFCFTAGPALRPTLGAEPVTCAVIYR